VHKANIMKLLLRLHIFIQVYIQKNAKLSNDSSISVSNRHSSG
jgi:hypothetical protein